MFRKDRRLYGIIYDSSMLSGAVKNKCLCLGMTVHTTFFHRDAIK